MKMGSDYHTTANIFWHKLPELGLISLYFDLARFHFFMPKNGKAFSIFVEFEAVFGPSQEPE